MPIGGLFDLSSKSNAEDKRIAAENSVLAYGQNNQSGQYNFKGTTKIVSGLDISGAKVAAGGTLALTFGDPQPLEDLSKDFSLTVKEMSQQNSSALSAGLTGLGDQLKTALSGLTKLGESNQTGGDSGRNQIILWVVLGVLGLVGLLFYLRR